ncbi:porin family protein [Candidatus Deianiraea vastatrix]|uniref:Outer membrane protein n=1 Tax=Candidatus Deianiraea vastatrix TaxID=2163644 RepID=A0A5B8XDA7_9RICK|nr:porin [Candidatus Deianiraea vastatrix]QED22875.1 Putative outer membrane protein [Candidatus Deianiraea vastatrix]
MKIALFILTFLLYQSLALAKDEEVKDKVFLSLGGYVDSNFANTSQSEAYSRSVMPNYNSTLDSVNRQNSTTSLQTRTHSRIDLSGGVNLANGTKIGATVVMNSLITQSDDDKGSYANQNFVFLETDYGRTELGVSPSASSRMRVDAVSIARATGGIGGDWWRFVGMPTFNTSGLTTAAANELSAGYMPMFIFAPMLPNEAGFTTGASSSMFIYQGQNQTNPQMTNGKYDVMYYNRQQPRYGYGLQNGINYFTPRYNGIQFGLSFAPDTGNAGGVAQSNSSFLRNGAGNQVGIGGRTTSASGDVRNYISMGLNYKEQFDNLGVAIGATYETGKAEDIYNPYGINGGCGGFGGSCVNGYNGRRNLSAWSIGSKLLYGGFSLAGSYGSWGNSLQPNANFTKDSSGNYLYPWLVPFNSDGSVRSDYQKSGFYNYGVAYGFGPINFSITQIHTNYVGNKMDATSFGTDFKVGTGKFKGFIPYIEYTIFKMQGAPVYLQSMGQTFTPIENKGSVLLTGVRVIF